MPATYKYYDENSIERTISSVLDPVALSSVVTTSGSADNIITVSSTAGIFPGMAIKAKNVPLGAFVHSVVSSTQLELWATTWNATTGAFTTSAANANATAAATGGTGHALGFDPCLIVARWYALGKWRNIHSSDTRMGTGATTTAHTQYSRGQLYGIGVATVPTGVSTPTGTTMSPTAGSVRLSDTLAETPLKRDNGEPWGFYMLVSSLGHISRVQARPGTDIIYTGSS